MRIALVKLETNFIGPQHQLAYLLENITMCDLQILHDGSDFGNYNTPAKVIFMSSYSKAKLDNQSAVGINVLRFRTQQYKLSFFLLKLLNEPNRINDSVMPLELELLINITINYHMFHLSGSIELESHRLLRRKRRYYLYGDIMLVVLIANQRKKELSRFVKPFMLPQMYNTYTLVISYLSDDNRMLEVCGVPDTYPVIFCWSSCVRIFDWDKRLDITSTWTPKFWLFMEPATEVSQYSSTIYPSQIAKNPFERNENYTMGQWTGSVLSKLNITVHHSFEINFVQMAPQLNFIYNLEEEDFIYANKYAYIHSIKPFIPVITKTTGFKYFTCYRERYHAFKIYIAPFQPQLWLALLITVVLLISLTRIYKYFRKVSFCSWLFILATMFKETTHVPKLVEQRIHFRLTSGFWCLIAVIVTNCYNGIMISELNAPLSSVEAKTFSDLMCNKLSLDETDKMLTMLNYQHEATIGNELMDPNNNETIKKWTPIM